VIVSRAKRRLPLVAFLDANAIVRISQIDLDKELTVFQLIEHLSYE
jgi:hypothetical protein